MPASHSDGSALDLEMAARTAAHVLSRPAETIGPAGIVPRNLKPLPCATLKAVPANRLPRLLHYSSLIGSPPIESSGNTRLLFAIDGRVEPLDHAQGQVC